MCGKDAARETALVRNLGWLQDRCKSDLGFILSRLQTLAEESAARDADAARCLLPPSLLYAASSRRQAWSRAAMNIR